MINTPISTLQNINHDCDHMDMEHVRKLDISYLFNATKNSLTTTTDQFQLFLNIYSLLLLRNVIQHLLFSDEYGSEIILVMI